MQNKKRHSRKFLAILLTMLFAVYYSGSTLFIHTHFINSGAITHSHPYKSDKPHSHSANEYEVLAALCDITAEEVDFADVPVEDEQLLGIFLVSPVSEAPVAPAVEVASRAPPACFI